jgi:hypothetical protein
MRTAHVAPVPMDVASLSARGAVRATKVSRSAAKPRGAVLALRPSTRTVCAAVVPPEVLTNAVPVPVNGDAAHVTCGTHTRLSPEVSAV